MNTKGKIAPGTVDTETDGGAVVVVVLGKRNPLVAVTDDVVVVPVDPPTRIPPVLDTVFGPVAVPPIVPVHAARMGQHATFPAASRAQSWFVGQHALLFPSALQFV